MAVANAHERWSKATIDDYKPNITEEVPMCQLMLFHVWNGEMLMTLLLFVQIKALLYIYLKPMDTFLSGGLCTRSVRPMWILYLHLFYVIDIWGFRHERMTSWSPNEENQWSRLTLPSINTLTTQCSTASLLWILSHYPLLQWSCAVLFLKSMGRDIFH